ncbi:hypothetical protein L0244_17345 [bacterium]|nr:hypothetical protein [bacterium]
MQKEVLKVQENHLHWWSILKEDRVKVLAYEIRSYGENFLFLACVAISGQIIPFEDYGLKLLTQPQAESLVLDLVAACKLGNSQQVNPIIQKDTVMLYREQDAVWSIPLLVSSFDPQNEPATVDAIARMAYFLTTGIDASAFASKTNLKKTILPPASHWNKDIDQRLSSVFVACLDPKSPQRMVSFSDLELRLNPNSDQNTTRTTSGNDLKHQPV